MSEVPLLLPLMKSAGTFGAGHVTRSNSGERGGAWSRKDQLCTSEAIAPKLTDLYRRTGLSTLEWSVTPIAAELDRCRANMAQMRHLRPILALAFR